LDKPEKEVIEVRVGELRQFWDSIDPSPFRERDLDPKVERYIVEWAREVAPHVPLSLRVCIDSPVAPVFDDNVVSDSVHQYFAYRATSTRRELRQLLHLGRTSLLIGLLALSALTGLSELVAHEMKNTFGEVLQQGLLIGGWVAMWRPLEIFLYDWWPIRREEKLYERLSTMPVDADWSSKRTGQPT
jgi:hypothetical protein